MFWKDSIHFKISADRRNSLYIAPQPYTELAAPSNVMASAMKLLSGVALVGIPILIILAQTILIK